jgi:hypothetical protein
MGRPELCRQGQRAHKRARLQSCEPSGASCTPDRCCRPQTLCRAQVVCREPTAIPAGVLRPAPELSTGRGALAPAPSPGRRHDAAVASATSAPGSETTVRCIAVAATTGSSNHTPRALPVRLRPAAAARWPDDHPRAAQRWRAGQWAADSARLRPCTRSAPQHTEAGREARPLLHQGPQGQRAPGGCLMRASRVTCAHAMAMCDGDGGDERRWGCVVVRASCCTHVCVQAVVGWLRGRHS